MEISDYTIGSKRSLTCVYTYAHKKLICHAFRYVILCLIYSAELKAVEATTDSEDQCGKITKKLSALALPTNNSLVSGGDLESDSVNELYSERKSTDRKFV